MFSDRKKNKIEIENVKMKCPSNMDIFEGHFIFV